ncbi:MAG: SMP-30/gluconolactonase/LRE family protein [Rhodobacteraceae bacterium]|nr:SMP-30/gluconolactonase/LRE family protein [Paracoccaceae bacterium]
MPSNGRVFAHLHSGHGAPEGSCVDAEGGLWSACYGDAAERLCLVVAQVDRIVGVPVPHVTCCALAGFGCGGCSSQPHVDIRMQKNARRVSRLVVSPWSTSRCAGCPRGRYRRCGSLEFNESFTRPPPLEAHTGNAVFQRIKIRS